MRSNREPLETCEHCRFRIGDECRRNPPSQRSPSYEWEYPIVADMMVGYAEENMGEVTFANFYPGCFAGEVE